MSLARRLEKLEAGQPPRDGSCYCGGLAGKVIRIYDGADSEADADRDGREAEPCEDCGGARELLQIVVIDPHLRAAA